VQVVPKGSCEARRGKTGKGREEGDGLDMHARCE